MPNTIVQHVMGCRLNSAEADKVRVALQATGWRVVPEVCDGAAAFHLHTCAVTARTENEALRRVRSAARAGFSEIVVSGCLANLPSAKAALQSAGATAIVSRHCAPDAAPTPLARIVAHALFPVAPVAPTAPTATVAPVAPTAPTARTRAVVKIQDGCSFRCAYCIVPDARGAPKSLPFADVEREVRAAVRTVPREVVLSGVNVGCWRDGALDFADAAAAIAQTPGVLRVRTSSLEPGTVEKKLAELIASAGGGICPTLHLPLQSGSDAVLSAMGRHYTAAEYADAVESALALVPRLGLGTDVITGFPGETEDDFAQTLTMIRRFPFSNLHVFPYSERPGTRAATMHGAVPVRVRRERTRLLVALGAEKRAAFAASFAGATVQVLAEAADADGGVSGWTGEYLRARIADCPRDCLGALVKARVESVRGDLLVCKKVQP